MDAGARNGWRLEDPDPLLGDRLLGARPGDWYLHNTDVAPEERGQPLAQSLQPAEVIEAARCPPGAVVLM